MCGILGYAGRLDRERRAQAVDLLRHLAIESEERGIDAAGYAALTEAGELIWRRQPGKARKLFNQPAFRCLPRRRLAMVVGHTRNATTGAPAVNGNNHPHLAGTWAVVHNGVLYDHEAAALGLRIKLRSDCDSELLARILARHGERRGPRICLETGGSQSVLAINARDGHLLAWTNGGMPMTAFRVEDWPAIWWASTEAIAARALAKAGLRATLAEVPHGVVYRMRIDRGGMLLVDRLPGIDPSLCDRLRGDYYPTEGQ